MAPRELFAADVVLDWNEQALDAIRAEKTPPPIASRSLALMHVAIYDTVNSLERTHQPYAVQPLAPPTASREAAVAAAAHQVLIKLFPTQRPTFDAALNASLATVANGFDETAGVALGRKVATQILALRSNDGSTATVTYTPGTNAGDWIPTPPAFAAGLLPGWGDVQPFAITSGSQFAPSGPPALTSAEYTAAFNEVKALGDVNSTTRTSDQSAIALFWANGAGTSTPPGHFNVIASIVATARHHSLADNARLFAMLNVALADAAIQSWHTKFDTDFWRPVTAIRAADTDGNAATAADVAWTPFIATPPFPTYTSGHATFSGAGAAVLTAFFGRDNVAFTLPSENPLVADRTFTSFSQAANESAESRLYGGIHWRFDNEDGLAAGTSVGRYVAQRFFRPQLKGAAAGIVNGALSVFGTNRADVIQVHNLGASLLVSLNGMQLGKFAARNVRYVSIDARGGNDVVNIAPLFVPSSINGGEGNDTLIGGMRRDILNGGEGNDYLFGLAGNDLLDGGNGINWLFGGLGVDMFGPKSRRDYRFQ